MNDLHYQEIVHRIRDEITDLDENTCLALDEFRRFRHLVRNVYTINLVPERMAGLISSLPILWDQLRKELLAFADFLERIIQKA